MNPEKPIVPLQRWSDITYLNRMRQVLKVKTAHADALKNVIIYNIEAPEFLATLHNAMTRQHPQPEALPNWHHRLPFPVNEQSQASLALLGMPQLAGTAKLLIQPKR